MKRLPLSTVLTAVAALGGASLAQLSTDQKTQLVTFLGEGLREAWQAFPWWQTERIEERQFRPSWDATATYALDAEVYDATASGYFRSLQAGNLNHAVTETAWWEAATDLDAYVSLEADANFPNATEMGSVLEVWQHDPRLRRSVRVPYVLRDGRLQFTPRTATVTVFVVFQAAAPVLDGTPWDAETTYGTGDVRYHEASGDCYRALNTVSGENPQLSDDWARVDFPEHLASIVKYLARAAALRADGQDDKATSVEAEARREMERTIVRNTTQQQQQAGYFSRAA